MSHLTALFHWLAEAWHTWLAMGVMFVACVVALRPHTPEPVIRLTGLVLQILGIATVIWGISETRALFGHPSLVSKVKSWLGRFPLLRKRVSIGAVTAHIAVGGTGRAHVTNSPGLNATIESRLESLEKNVVLIHERISNTEREMDGQFRKMLGSIKGEEQSRQSADNAIRETLEATATGGVHISAIGAAWVLVGVVFSTAAVEIAQLLK
jgi:hypothetical protein